MEKEGIWGVASDRVVRERLAENVTCKKRSERTDIRKQEIKAFHTGSHKIKLYMNYIEKHKKGQWAKI